MPSISLRKPNAGLRLPNRDYWLAPERQHETLEFLRQHMARFGSMLVVFLCYIHWLVVRANTLVPPRLPATWAIGGIVAFVVGALVWTRVLLQHFRKVPRQGRPLYPVTQNLVRCAPGQAVPSGAWLRVELVRFRGAGGVSGK